MRELLAPVEARLGGLVAARRRSGRALRSRARSRWRSAALRRLRLPARARPVRLRAARRRRAPPRLLFVGAEPRSAPSRARRRAPTTSCDGSRSTRARTRSSSRPRPGCATTCAALARTLIESRRSRVLDAGGRSPRRARRSLRPTRGGCVAELRASRPAGLLAPPSAETIDPLQATMAVDRGLRRARHGRGGRASSAPSVESCGRDRAAPRDRRAGSRGCSPGCSGLS